MAEQDWHPTVQCMACDVGRAAQISHYLHPCAPLCFVLLRKNVLEGAVCRVTVSAQGLCVNKQTQRDVCLKGLPGLPAVLGQLPASPSSTQHLQGMGYVTLAGHMHTCSGFFILCCGLEQREKEPVVLRSVISCLLDGFQYLDIFFFNLQIVR